MGKKLNQLRTGVLLSYVNLALGSIIPFIYTPIMLKMLGQEEYGLYSLAHSVVGYLSLLSFGFGTTIIRYLSKSRAEGNKQEEEQIFGFFLVLYGILALAVCIGGFLLGSNVEPIFHRGLTGSELVKMKTLVFVMAFNTAISFPISVFSSIIIAHERYIFKKLVDMLGTIAAPIANLIALYLGYESVGMAVAATIIQFLMLPASVGYCFCNLRMHPRFSKMPIAMIKEMFGFSAYAFLGSIVDMLFWATDKVILGMLASSVAVAVYNVGGTFNSMVIQLSTSISGVLTPKVTGMVVKDSPKEELTELFIRIGRLQFIIIGLIVSGFTVFGQVFINLWAGADYGLAFWVAILTMFPLSIPLIQNTGLTIVIAQNKHQFRSVVYLVIAIANVVSTYIVVPYAGIIGAAVCSCISYLLGQGIIMNIYYYKVTKINIPLFWMEILKMSIIPASMMVIGLFLLRIVKINNWWTFLLGVGIFSLCYALLMYRFSLNDYEKDIFRKPILSVIRKAKLH